MTLADAYDVFLDQLNTLEGTTPGDINLAVFKRYINEAEVEACKRWDLIFDTDTAAVVEITTVDGTRSYALHSKILKVVRAEYYDSTAGYRIALKHEPYDNLERKYGASWRTSTGRPTSFAVRGRRLYLYPTPDAAAVVNLEVWRLPLAALIEDDDEFEIAAAYQEDLMHWALYRARSRREEELGDPLGASFHLQNFERVFGVPVSAQVLQVQLENPPEVDFNLWPVSSEDDDDE